MTRKSRFDSIYSKMSGAEKGRLMLEDFMCDPTMLDESERKRIMDSVNPTEGPVFNRVIDEFDGAWTVLRILAWTVNIIYIQLLERDRLLWYLRALVDLAEATSAKLISVDDDDRFVGPDFTVRCFFASVRVGLWEEEITDYEIHQSLKVEPKILQTLDLQVSSLRTMAAEAKAGEEFAREVADHLELPTLSEKINEVVAPVAEFDRPLEDELLDLIRRGGPINELRRPIFPIGRRWALVWEDLEIINETQDQIREDPGGWSPTS